MSFPKSPIDTDKHMRDQGRGYPEFDYAAAWREARPLWDALPANLRELFAETRKVAADARQDKNTDLPWLRTPGPLTEGFKGRFHAIPATDLEHAASVIHALGHWLPGDAPPEDRLLFAGSPPDGAYWKFAHYADQSIRERQGRPWSGREPRPKTELEKVCEELGIEVRCRRGTSEDYDEDDWRAKANAWTVTLQFGAATSHPPTMTVPFWQGAAHTKQPTAADVLSCLVSDAASVESARSFEDWVHEFGFDLSTPGSLKKARRTYDDCERIGERLKKFLGPTWDRVIVAASEH